MTRDGIAKLMLEVFTEDELRQLRKDVQYGRCSTITVIEWGEPIRWPEVESSARGLHNSHGDDAASVG